MVNKEGEQMAYERFTNSDNELVLGITEELRDYEQMDEVDAELATLGYKKDEDYYWGIAGGDDLPHAFIVTSDKLKQDEAALDLLSDYEGMSVYDEEYTQYDEEEDEEDEEN
jgi:hypothetical protein